MYVCVRVSVVYVRETDRQREEEMFETVSESGNGIERERLRQGERGIKVL